MGCQGGSILVMTLAMALLGKPDWFRSLIGFIIVARVVRPVEKHFGGTGAK
jgi:hypothetical protein